MAQKQQLVAVLSIFEEYTKMRKNKFINTKISSEELFTCMICLSSNSQQPNQVAISYGITKFDLIANSIATWFRERTNLLTERSVVRSCSHA